MIKRLTFSFFTICLLGLCTVDASAVDYNVRLDVPGGSVTLVDVDEIYRVSFGSVEGMKLEKVVFGETELNYAENEIFKLPSFKGTLSLTPVYVNNDAVAVAEEDAVNTEYDFSVDGLGYTINKDGKSVTLSYAEPSLSGKVTVPATVSNDGTGYVIDAIGDGAFKDCADITHIYVENADGARYSLSVGPRAFAGCTSLRLLDLPEDTESCNKSMILGCRALETIICRAEYAPNSFDTENTQDEIDEVMAQLDNQAISLYITPAAYNKGKYYQSGYWSKFNLKQLTDTDVADMPVVSMQLDKGSVNLYDVKPGNRMCVLTAEGKPAYQVKLGGTILTPDENGYITMPTDMSGDINMTVSMKKESTSAIDSVMTSPRTTLTINGLPSGITTEHGKAITISDISGRICYTGHATAITLDKGIYIITDGKATARIKVN